MVNHHNFAHFSISQTPLYWETNEIAHRSRDDEIVIDRSCCFERCQLVDHQPADFLSSMIEWFIFRLHAMTSTFQLYEQHRFCIESRDKRRIFFWWNISKQNKSIYKAELSMFTCNTYGAKPSDHIIILIFIWISLSHKNLTVVLKCQHLRIILYRLGI